MNLVLNKGKKMKKMKKYLLALLTSLLFIACSSKSYHTPMNERIQNDFGKVNLEEFRKSYSESLINQKNADATYISILKDKSLSQVLKELEIFEESIYFLKTKDIIIPTSRLKIHTIKELNDYLVAVLNKKLYIEKNQAITLVSLLNVSESKKRYLNETAFILKGEISVEELIKLITLHTGYQVSIGSDLNDHQSFKNSLISIQSKTVLSAINALSYAKNIYIDVDYDNELISIQRYKDLVIEIAIPLLNLETSTETSAKESSADSSVTSSSKIVLYDELNSMIQSIIAQDKISTYHIDKASGLIFIKANKRIEKTIRKIVKAYEDSFAKEATIEFERIELVLNKNRKLGISSISKKPSSSTDLGTFISTLNNDSINFLSQGSSRLLEILATSNNSIGTILNYSKNLLVLKNNVPSVQTISQNTDYIEKIVTTVVDSVVTSEATVNTIKDGTTITALAKISRDKIFLNITPSIKKLIRISSANIGEATIQLPEYKFKSYNISREIRLGETVVVGSIIVHDDAKEYEGIVPMEGFIIGGLDSKSYVRREIVYLITVKSIKGF